MMALCPFVLEGALTGYLKIPDIAGESQRADHEDEIDIHDIQWMVAQAASVEVGSSRTRARAVVSPLKVRKFMDASSPYLALACMQGKSFPDMVLTLRKDSGDAHLDYLVITMTNAQVVSYEMVTEEGSSVPTEEVGIMFESITIKYTVQADDHSAGDEHEITYDIAAGV
jgi:type VI secretion system secreted protein Hcp